MSYKVVRDSLGEAVCFGPNDGNYEPSLSAGEVLSIEDAEPVMPEPVPQVVSMAQARKALVLGGVSMAAVASAIAAISNDTDRELAQIDWEYSITVKRVSPLVASLGPSLNLTDAQIDALFVAAQRLT